MGQQDAARLKTWPVISGKTLGRMTLVPQGPFQAAVPPERAYLGPARDRLCTAKPPGLSPSRPVRAGKTQPVEGYPGWRLRLQPGGPGGGGLQSREEDGNCSLLPSSFSTRSQGTAELFSFPYLKVGQPHRSVLAKGRVSPHGRPGLAKFFLNHISPPVLGGGGFIYVLSIVRSILSRNFPSDAQATWVRRDGYFTMLIRNFHLALDI